MKSLQSPLIFCLFVTVITGCAKKAGESPVGPVESGQVSSTANAIPTDENFRTLGEAENLWEDIERLKYLSSPNTKTYPNMADDNVLLSSAQGIVKFIDDRVNFVVLKKGTEGNKFLAFNISYGLYTEGLARQQLSTFLGFPVDTPRIGIVEIGLLYDKNYIARFDDKGALVNSLTRVTTLAHEGRHSDGNKQTLAFPHGICPSRHDYYDQYACDAYSNGSYWVSLKVVETFLAQCKAPFCNAGDLEILRLKKKSYQIRILGNKGLGDPRPVRYFKAPFPEIFQLYNSPDVL